MKSDSAPVVLWLRRELRLADNAALAAAVASGRPVLPVFVLDDAAPGAWRLGGASRWWLHGSLAALADALAGLGSSLILRHGDTAAELSDIVRASGAVAVHAGQPIEPWARLLVADLPAALGVTLHLHRTTTLFDPDAVRTLAGGPYGVFTPFARACRARFAPAAPLPAPSHLGAAPRVRSDTLDSLRLRPHRPDWAAGFAAVWSPDAAGEAPGETNAQQRLKRFFQQALANYDVSRNSPGLDGTSMLSPRLHWGEISPRQAWQDAEAAHPGARGTQVWTDEVLWREFSAHLLWHHPTLPEQPLRGEFAAMRWRRDAAGLRAWQRGRTGLPIVDAGMRQLWTTGWMHNRVRMIVASFLVKHLLLPWQQGAAWFWDTLVDADLASNSAQWQWVAGCGADAAPFFRVFNPVLQGRKFDADGAYVRRYVPELAALPDRFLHAPWEAPANMLADCHIVFGQTYPRPILDLSEGRTRALAAFRALPARQPPARQPPEPAA